jgi:hypothetical protein
VGEEKVQDETTQVLAMEESAKEGSPILFKVVLSYYGHFIGLLY